MRITLDVDSNGRGEFSFLIQSQDGFTEDAACLNTALDTIKHLAEKEVDRVIDGWDIEGPDEGPPSASMCMDDLYGCSSPEGYDPEADPDTSSHYDDRDQT